MSTLIPLANPVAAVPDDVVARHERTILIPGVDRQGMARLQACKVLVVGAGGLGSPVLTYLASSGVGQLGVADSDLVEESNLPRQLVHLESSVGQAKTSSAKAHILGLNSSAQVDLFQKITSGNINQIFSSYDLILDCSDNFETKYLIADWCGDNGKPLVWGSVVELQFQLSVFWSATPHPGPKTKLRDIFPTIPEPGATLSANKVGVLGPAAGVCGSLMACEAIKLVTGIGEPLIGRILVGDIRNGSFDIVRFG